MMKYSKYLLETLNLLLYFPMQQLQAHLSALYLSGESSERSKQRKAGEMASRTMGCQASIDELVFKIVFDF